MHADPPSNPPLPPDTVRFSVDYVEERSRLTTFFRVIMVIPHVLWLMLYAIPTFFAVVAAWFAIVFTAKYPLGLYDFVQNYTRYQTRVYAYLYLATDTFPPFDGNPDHPYEAHYELGPPLEQYSRAKAFFRIILVIPFYIVAYVLTLIYQLAAFVAWFVIVFSGKQPKGLQDAIIFGFSYTTRLNAYYALQVEDWPVYWTDSAVDEDLARRGYPTGSAPMVAPEMPIPPAPPAPPAPPTPPAGPAV